VQAINAPGTTMDLREAECASQLQRGLIVSGLAIKTKYFSCSCFFTAV
jgi:hypothetical protein